MIKEAPLETNNSVYVEQEETTPVSPYEYVDELPKVSDHNRRYVDALNEASRASAFGQDPVPVFANAVNNTEYDPEDRANKILGNLNSAVSAVEDTQYPDVPEEEKFSAVESGISSRMKDIFMNKHPVTTMYNVSQKGRNRDVDELKSTSEEALLEARSYIASLPSYELLTDKEKEDAAFSMYTQFMAAKVADDIGWNGGTVADFLGFLVPQENIRYEEVANVLGVEYKEMDYVDYRSFLAQMGFYVRNEAPDKRQELVEKLIEAWPEIHGNNRVVLYDTLNIIAGTEDPEGFLRAVDNYSERADQVTLGLAGLGKIVTGAMKGVNAIRTAVKTKNVEAVSDLVTAGSQGLLNEAGITPFDAASSLNPMESNNALAKGADNTFASEVGIIQTDVDRFLEAANKVNNYGLGLSPEEQVLARERAVKALEDRGDIYGVVAEPVDDVTFQVSYRIKGEKGAEVVTQYYKQSDNNGGFVSKDGKDYNPLDLKVTSPMFRYHAKDDRKLLVNYPEQIQFQGNKIQDLYDKAVRAALAPDGKKLSSKEMKQVEHVLLKGDEHLDNLGYNTGKVFSDEELMNEGVEGVVLNTRQVKAYKDMRKVLDHLHMVKNKEILDRWNAKGLKIATFGETRSPVKVYERVEDAKAGFSSADAKSHWIGTDTDKLFPLKDASGLTEDLLHKMYSSGYRLVRAAENKLIAGPDTGLEWSFVKAENLSNPSGIVLAKKTGYVPRIKRDAFYFVKEKSDLKVGGRVIQGGSLKTVRYFDNYTDAAKYQEEMNAKFPDKYVVLADREMSSSAVDEELINISGGLFTGKRSEGVPFGLDGKDGTRVDVLGSIQRYVKNIARNVPMNLYRVGIQQRWINHAKDVKALPGNYAGSFEDAIHPRTLDMQNPTAQFLIDAHHQISTITGVRTDAEMEMLAKYRSVARKFEHIPVFGRYLNRMILDTSTEGISAAIRGASFHLLLGLFNPAQLPIQASGAFVAMTVHPVHGLKAVGQMLGYATMDALLGSKANKLEALKAMKAKGFDLDGYEAWDRSGLRESILKSNLDYNSVFTDMPYDAGVLNKILSNSSFFHKSGELVSARVAFATAYNYWRATNKSGEVTNEALKAILARTETFRLNMTKANSAKFQQGLLSIPTQFEQVNTKFFEKLLGRGELTKAEKARLFVGQFVLFGASGIPLMKTLLPLFAAAINPLLPEEHRLDAINASPETLNFWNNGMLAWIVNDYMDINSVVTGRMALGQDFVENLFGLLTESVVVSDIALGPTKSLWDGINDGLSRTITALTIVNTAEDATVEDYAAVGSILAQSVLNLPATTRNLIKSYDMTHSQFFRNKNGRPIAEWGDMNTQTIVAQALGFAPEEVAAFHELNNRNLGVIPKSVFKADSDRIVRFLVDMHSNKDDDTNSRRYAMAVNAVLSKYDRWEDRVKLIKEVENKLKDPSDPWGKLMLSVIEDWQSDLQKGVAEIHARAATKINPAVARRFEERGMNKANEE